MRVVATSDATQKALTERFCEMVTNIAFIGIGEAGSAFVSGWAQGQGLAIAA
jgi:hypothetical protein